MTMNQQADLIEAEREALASLAPDTVSNDGAGEITPKHKSAREVAESILGWASDHHLLDPACTIAQAAPAVAPSDGTLFNSAGNSLHLLRSKVMAGALYNEGEKTVYVLTRKKLSAAAQKNMPAWHSGIVVKYIHFGQAQSGGLAPASDGLSYREYQGRYCCGSSIHPARYPGAGTIGCLLRDDQGQLYGLTANHVSGLANYADEGEKILAPGHIDITPKGRDPFTIGVHIKALPMNHGSPTNVNISENTDAAIFQIRNADSVSSSQGGYFDTPAQVADPVGGMLLEKVGRTTGHTMGRVIGLSPTPVPVGYQLPAVGGNATVYFNQLVTVIGENGAPFSLQGDSGALVIGMAGDGSTVAVGLVIAGTNTGYSLILPLRPILASLNMTLVSQHHA